MLKYSLAMLFAASGVLAAQEPPEKAKPGEYTVVPGTRIPLGLINTVSTKNSQEGDHVYLETEFPIVVGGRIVIPAGSYVAGTLTQVKRPERRDKGWHGKGRGELFLRFDSMTLPNGVTRDFRARVSAIDGQGSAELDRSEGKVSAESDKTGQVRTVAETAAAGTSIGLIAGSASHNLPMGAGLGAAAGAAAGLMGILLTRGPDVVLAKGSTLEMVTDRPLIFAETELDFGNSHSSHFGDGPAPAPEAKTSSNRRWPF